MKKFKGKGYKNGTKAPPGSQHFKKPKKQLVDCTDEKLMLQLLSELLLPNGKILKFPVNTVSFIDLELSLGWIPRIFHFRILAILNEYLENHY